MCLVLNAFLLLFQKMYYSPKEIDLDFYLTPYKYNNWTKVLKVNNEDFKNP